MLVRQATLSALTENYGLEGCRNVQGNRRANHIERTNTSAITFFSYDQHLGDRCHSVWNQKNMLWEGGKRQQCLWTLSLNIFMSQVTGKISKGIIVHIRIVCLSNELCCKAECDSLFNRVAQKDMIFMRKSPYFAREKSFEVPIVIHKPTDGGNDVPINKCIWIHYHHQRSTTAFLYTVGKPQNSS